MKKSLIILVIIVGAYTVLKYVVNRPSSELQTISQDKASSETVHKIDDLLTRRMSVVMSKKQEDELLSNQYDKDYEDEISRSGAIISYFQKRQDIAGAIKNEIDGGCKELHSLFLEYEKGEYGYELVNTFRNYFHAYKRFVDAAYRDIEDKVQAAMMYKTIVSLETNEQSFFEALEEGDIPKAKKLLDREGELIANYKQNIGKIHYKSRIPDKWKQEFVDTYTLIHECDTTYFEAKQQNNQVLYDQLVMKGAKVMANLPFIKSFIFSNELQKIITDIPEEIDKLQNKSAESGKRAYTLYYIQKKKIGENPEEIIVFQ